MRSSAPTLTAQRGGKRRELPLALLPDLSIASWPAQKGPCLAWHPPTHPPTYLTRGWAVGVPARSRPGRGPTPRESPAPGQPRKQRGARQDQSGSTGSRRPCSAPLCHASHATPLHPAARGGGRREGSGCAGLINPHWLPCLLPGQMGSRCAWPLLFLLPPQQAAPSESFRRPRALTPLAVWPERWGRRAVRGLP